jgi:hypothetical protein
MTRGLRWFLILCGGGACWTIGIVYGVSASGTLAYATLAGMMILQAVLVMVMYLILKHDTDRLDRLDAEWREWEADELKRIMERFANTARAHSGGP